MSSRYRLVFRGKMLPGLLPEQVAENLAGLFRISLEQAQGLIATAPTTIKQNVDLETGNRYLEALAEAGLITHMELLESGDAPPLVAGWDGIERRQADRRRQQRDRRDVRRGTAIQPDRRQRGRRQTD